MKTKKQTYYQRVDTSSAAVHTRGAPAQMGILAGTPCTKASRQGHALTAVTVQILRSVLKRRPAAAMEGRIKPEEDPYKTNHFFMFVIIKFYVTLSPD